MKTISESELSYQISRYLLCTGQSPETFAESCGISVSTVKTAISEKAIPVSAMMSICEQLHITLDSLRHIPKEKEFSKYIQGLFRLAKYQHTFFYKILKRQFTLRFLRLKNMERMRYLNWLHHMLENTDIIISSRLSSRLDEQGEKQIVKLLEELEDRGNPK